jgi:hypothetical protein
MMTAQSAEAGSEQQVAVLRQTTLVAPPLEQLALQVRVVTTQFGLSAFSR